MAFPSTSWCAASGPMGNFSYNGRTRSSAPTPSRDLTKSWRRVSSSPTPPSLSSSSSSSFSSSSPPSSPAPSPPHSSSPTWRAGASSVLSRVKMPSFDKVELGMVFHLPVTPAPADSRIQAKLAREPQSPWNHPIVITRKWEENGEQCVSFAGCTTFKGQRIEDVKKEHEQIQFLLAANSQDEVPHGNTRLAMMEDKTKKFSRRTYVNLSPGSDFEIEYKHLELYGFKPPMKLNGDALKRILEGTHRRQAWGDYRRTRSA